MRVAQAFQQTKVSHLDLSGFVRAAASTHVAAVLERMRSERATVALVEGDDDNLVGIFTERDVLLRVADADATLKGDVSAVMTPGPQVLTENDTVGKALTLMTDGHYRHMPVLGENGDIIGILSQHAVIRFLADHFPREIYNLPPDPELISRSREGA